MSAIAELTAPADPFLPAAPPEPAEPAVTCTLGKCELFEQTLSFAVEFAGPLTDPRSFLRDRFRQAQDEWKTAAPEYQEWQAAADALLSSERELTEAAAELETSRVAWLMAVGKRADFRQAEERYRQARSSTAVIEERLEAQRGLVNDKKQAAVTVWNSLFQTLIVRERQRVEADVPALRATIGQQLDAAAFLGLYDAISQSLFLHQAGMSAIHLAGLVQPL